MSISLSDIISGNYPKYSWTRSYFAMANQREEIECSRIERLELIYKIATKTWKDYLRKPGKVDTLTWNNISERFTIVNLQSPVLETIVGASHGGKITRRIKRAAVPIEDLQQMMKECCYEAKVAELAVPQSCLYGTSYLRAGWRLGRFNLTLLPSVATEIITPDHDATDIMAVVSHFANMEKIFTADGGVYTHRHGSQPTVIDKPFGFLPIAIFRGKYLDPAVPYGDELVWPATNETRQCTYLNNDIMVLEKLQSYSTLVIKGNEMASTGAVNNFGPFAHLRLDAGDSNDAKYISPQAKIQELDGLMTSKFERCATQCQVPVEIFTRAKAGTNQSAGSSYLTHKPLYDLVVSIQERKAREEHELLSIMSAMLEWSRNGNRPVDIQRHRDELDLELLYDRESNPSINQSDAQTISHLVDANLLPHHKAYWLVNRKDGTDEEQKELEKRREQSQVVSISKDAYDGFSSDESNTIPLKP